MERVGRAHLLDIAKGRKGHGKESSSSLHERTRKKPRPKNLKSAIEILPAFFSQSPTVLYLPIECALLIVFKMKRALFLLLATFASVVPAFRTAAGLRNLIRKQRQVRDGLAFAPWLRFKSCLSTPFGGKRDLSYGNFF
jgi:hypothetical protein